MSQKLAPLPDGTPNRILASSDEFWGPLLWSPGKPGILASSEEFWGPPRQDAPFPVRGGRPGELERRGLPDAVAEARRDLAAMRKTNLNERTRHA